MKDIKKIITDYAKAYEALEDFQRNNNQIIPIGDQKTGVIGEFLGFKIIEQIYPNAQVTFSSNHSQKGFDVLVQNENCTEYFQIKTISDYSLNGTSSKVHLHFKHKSETQKLNGLLIIFLKKNLLEGKYILLNDSEIEELDGKRLRRNTLINNSKTKQFKYGENI